MKKSIFDKHVTDGDHYAYATSTDKFHQEGLTKRELFAAMAMQGMAANPADNYLAEVDGKIVNVTSKYAVEYADALITELNKGVQS